MAGFAIGMMRTVIPALAEYEFGVTRSSFLLLTAFVVAFGVVKAVMNFVAGQLSERIGRQRVLLWGRIIALPIPVKIWVAPNWGWIVAATPPLFSVDVEPFQVPRERCRPGELLWKIRTAARLIQN